MGKNFTLQDFAATNALVVIFTCYHYLTAQSYKKGIIDLVNDYKNNTFAHVTISPNEPLVVCLD